MKKMMIAALALSLSLMAFAKGKEAKSADGKLTTVTGWVSDSACATDASKAHDADCVKKCIDGGKSMVIVNDKDNSVWTVKNPEALKGHEGHHVKVKAKLDESNHSLTVDKLSMLRKSKQSGEEKKEQK